MSDTPSDTPTAEDPPAGPYDPSAVLRARNLLDETPQQIGRYRILERIGGGGMGEVYRAEQRAPVRREVAIKLIKLGMDTRLVIARFEAERQALAMMEHPNIAKVYDADADATGRPYFVMEYVKGKPITEYADANHLSIDERLELFEQVCHAVQHAHHKGVIHRDLKPGNVLVSTQDGKAFAKVIDFGIAKATSKLTDKTLYTQHEQFIGTPQYVSPEQADGSLDIDTRTDVYSLGVLLYELLAGSTPFASDELRAAAVEKIKQMIREVDPPKPSTRLSMSTQTLPALAAARRVDTKKLGSLVRGELDWIVMKALEKDRRRRYETPTALANDVRAHLNGEPVTAAPPTARYRFQKFVYRNKAPLAAAAALGVALLAGAVVSTWQALCAGRAERTVTAQLVEVDRQRTFAEINRQDAEEARAAAEKQAKLAAKSASLSRARYLIQQGDLPGAMTSITQAAAAGLSYADRLVLDEAYRVTRDHWTLVSQVRTGIRPAVGCMVDFDDGKAAVVAVVGDELISVPADDAKPQWQHLAIDVTPKALLPTRAGTVIGWTPSGRVRAFAVEDLKLTVLAQRDFGGSLEAAAASDKSVTLVFLDGTCRTIDARTLNTIHEWPPSALPVAIRAEFGKRCAVSPDGDVVILHRGAWNQPAYVLRPGAAEAVEVKDIRMGHIAFTRPAPPATPTTRPTSGPTTHSFTTWMSPSGVGGLADLLSTYTIDAGSKVSYRDVQSVESIDTKLREAFRISPFGRMTMFGQVGMTWIGSRVARATLPSARYTAFWPFPEAAPEFLATDEAAERLVLSLRDGIVVFRRNKNPSGFITLDNYSSWEIRSGLLKMGNGPEVSTISFEPYDPTRPTWSVTAQWIQCEPASSFKGFSPWRLHVTDDEQHAVVLAQENDGENTISSVYGRKVAMVYALHGDARRAEGWKKARQVELSALAGMTGFGNGALRITPDGKTVLLGWRSQLHRYDVGSSDALGVLDFERGWFDMSPDGKFVVGRIPSTQDVAVYDTASGETVCTLADVGSFGGGTFSEDGRSVIVKGSGNNVTSYELPSGRVMWVKRSNLSPRNWPAAGNHLLAMVPETSGEGAMLVLADKDTLEPLGVVSKAFDHLSQCGFSPSLDAIHTQVSRWQSRIVHMVDPDGLARLLKTPAGAGDASTNGTADALVVDARPVLAPPTTKSTAGEVLRGEDVAKIAKYLDREVTVDATVAKVTWTAARNAINIECAGGANAGDAPPLLVWVNSVILRQIRAGGLDLDPDRPTLEGKRLLVRGRVGVYGGYDARFKGHPQIYVEDPRAFTILEPPPQVR